MNKIILVSALFGLALAQNVVAADQSIKQQVQQAMKAEFRDEADTKRDANRMPAEAMEFIGLKEDMKVIEFIPGGSGWYTKLLAPILKNKGELYLAQPAAWFGDLEKLVDGNKALSKAKKLPLKDIGWDQEKKEMTFNNGLDFGMTDADMFLNIRMYHNLPDADRSFFNNAVYDSLKAGGKYVVITHTRRHGQQSGPENWRREDPVRVISEVQDAGFELTKYSTMFYRADDTLEYEVARKTVTGNTDRFFLVFTKPAK